MQTRTVTFSYGTVKEAALEIPAEPTSIIETAKLIRSSYLKYAFRPGCGLMSDECVTSSIGHSNFMAGALGGYETRLVAADFAALKDIVMDDMAMALAVVRFRNPELSNKEAWIKASENEVLSEDMRKAMRGGAELMF
jgi:hypothetical protein